MPDAETGPAARSLTRGGDVIPISDRWRALGARVEAALARGGRAGERVTVVAVTKTVPAATVLAALETGIVDMGENRVQEAREKIPAVAAGWPGRAPAWHLIGHLQSNKAGPAARLFDWVHSIDSDAIARELGRRAVAEGRTLRALVEVNVSGEAAKHGVPPEEALALARSVSGVEGLELRGLMTVGPLTGDLGRVRAAFRTLAALGERLADERGGAMERSMGMSGDFEIAIEEGATMIRVGSALFGARS